MGIFNWTSNKKTNDKTSSKKEEITVEKALAFSKTYEELKPFFALFLHCFKSIFDSEKEIRVKLKEIQTKTQQNVKEEELIKDFLTLRYVSLHAWFFDLKPPQNQEDLSDELLVISSALKSVLKERNKLDYISWLQEGLSEYVGAKELKFDNLEDFKESFPNKLAEKMTRIPFDSTGGRLGGELHDFITELIMTTFTQDRKTFNLDDDINLSKEETDNIKKTIEESKPTEQDFVNFLDSITCLTLEDAQNVANDYADFLANCIEARLHTIFFSKTPESLLPYSHEYLEKALNEVAKHHHEKGDTDKVKLYQEILSGLWGFENENDEKIMTETAKRLGDKKWKDMVVDLVKDFRTNPAHKNYIENYKKISLESIDFDNLDIPTAHKIVSVFGIFLHQGHMLLSTLFSAKIPEGFLPFPKEQLFKAIDIYINAYKSIEHENAETYAYAKTIINEDYIDNELAIDELMKNLSNSETRKQIIIDLKEYQITTARKKYVDRLGLK